MHLAFKHSEALHATQTQWLCSDLSAMLLNQITLAKHAGIQKPSQVALNIWEQHANTLRSFVYKIVVISLLANKINYAKIHAHTEGESERERVSEWVSHLLEKFIFLVDSILNICYYGF